MYADFRVGLPVALACTWYGSPFGLVGYSPSYVSLPSHPPPLTLPCSVLGPPALLAACPAGPDRHSAYAVVAAPCFVACVPLAIYNAGSVLCSIAHRTGVGGLYLCSPLLHSHMGGPSVLGA